jgi:class 3 adenylate cyclase/tetratricopeptide (TPR) repeat protein
VATGEPRRERKVVTVVFCDLVGFTQRAEQLDPEDVEALLDPYHQRLRSELERHGGTVEKFIGDAVMALFGAPTAHEDDAERAVRACLAIRDWAVEEDDVQVRTAVTTGEALIRLDARPEAGEGMASGDVVNTASRLQSAAPVNGILVDETTYRATRGVVAFRETDAVDAKGKAEPIPVWEAVGARARFGIDVAHEARTELVGRERELAAVRDTFERARHGRTPQLLTLVGVPGMGKSRLVYELSRLVDADPELITWRQGRCLAYGDGVTLWALGEIVKAQAGILEQDGPNEIAAKISSAVWDALSGTGDETWVESHLLALVGLAGETELGGDRRNEAFAAWRRFLEALAEQRPLVLVFEDLHWADESLLDFVDELVDWVTDSPLLVVGTARPEMLDRRPGWGGGKLNATTLALSPLTDDQTALLLGRLLDRPVLAAASQQTLLERAGGNPLYAEQFAELYLEQGSADELRLPETLQGIIAARLDGLSQSEKTRLQDAAVIGKVFWASALETGSDDATAVLHSLERKGFVRRSKRSSVEGESEFAFAHALVRDVAYGQIARGDRSTKHRRIAEWIEALGRPEDHAEMLAHHWQAALEFARAAGRDDVDLETQARLVLREAGDRAFALNAYAKAEKYYADALALWPDSDAERPDLLFRRARSLHLAGDDRREQALQDARDALLDVGALESAAEAEAFLAHGAWYRGERDAVEPHFVRAHALVADRGASAAKARVLALSARFRMLAGEAEDAIRIAQEALRLAETLVLDELRAHALTTIGSSKARIDLSTGRAELEEGLALALTANSPTAATTLNNLAVLAIWEGDFPRASEIYPEAKRIAERFGDRDGLRFMRGNEIFAWYAIGRWDEAAEAADEFVAECASSPHYAEGIVREARASIRHARGDIIGAEEDREFELEQARRIKDPQRLLPSIASAVVHRVLLQNESEARALAEEALALVSDNVQLAAAASHVALVAGRVGIRNALREIVELAPEGPWKDLTLAATDGDLSRAADIYAGFGVPTFEALARLIGGESLIEEGRRTEGEAEIERALAFYRGVDAPFFVRRCEELLARSAYSDSA